MKEEEFSWCEGGRVQLGISLVGKLGYNDITVEDNRNASLSIKTIVLHTYILLYNRQYGS